MEKRVIKIRGYQLAAFKEYCFTENIPFKDHSVIKCGMLNPEETKEIYEVLRRANADVVIVDGSNDISHICEKNCRKNLSELEDCPNMHRDHQDKVYIKKFGFEVGKRYNPFEFLRLLGLDQGW
jgi:hypothetical protein